MSENQKNSSKNPRKPKEPTSRWLRDQALRYLNRFPATTMKMRSFLYEKSHAGMFAFEIPKLELKDRIEEEITKLVTAGFMNDQEFAKNKARVMARQGKSALQIRMKLTSMEFPEEMQEEAMEALGESDRALDRRAAALYVRKRKFGPYKDEKTRTARREKELASLARKGFSFDIANSIINAEDIEEIETLIYRELNGKIRE